MVAFNDKGEIQSVVVRDTLHISIRVIDYRNIINDRIRIGQRNWAARSVSEITSERKSP